MQAFDVGVLLSGFGHADPDAVLPQQFEIVVAAVLASPVGMMDPDVDVLLPTPAYGHAQGEDVGLGLQGGVDGEPVDEPVGDVHNGGEVEVPLADAVVGGVALPHLPVGMEDHALDEVGEDSGSGPGGPVVSPVFLELIPQISHQELEAVPTDPLRLHLCRTWP